MPKKHQNTFAGRAKVNTGEGKYPGKYLEKFGLK